MKKKEKTFYTIHRNKFMAIDAKSFNNFIDLIEGNLEILKEWQSAGVIFTGDGVGDDYATFSTTDPQLALDYGFVEEGEFFGGEFFGGEEEEE